MKSLVQYIAEMLKSQEAKLLKDKNEKLYDEEEIIEISLEDSSADKYKIIRIVFKDIKTYYSKYNRLKKFYDFYKYFVTIHREIEGSSEYEVFLEPEFSDQISSKIYDSFTSGGYGRILYHITDKSRVDGIMKWGLEVRSRKQNGELGYRNFPKRFFCFGGSEDEEIKSNINYIMDGMFGRNDKNDVVVIKIDLRKHKGLLFYTDPASGKEKNLMLYCNVEIPPKLLSIDKKYTWYANHPESFK